MKRLNLFVLIISILPLLSYCQEAAKTPPQKLSSKDYVVEISVELPDSAGIMKKESLFLILFNETPLHKTNFIKLAQEGFYTGTTFHRIIDGFMIQGGDPNSKDTDPNNDGMGGPSYTIPAEFNPEIKHVRGAVAAARMGDQMNPKRESNGSQFYIVENHQGTNFLDNSYTVFGQVIKNMDLVDKIAIQQKDFRDRPVKDIKMTVTVKQLKKKMITKLYGYQYK
jgi:cyclophilin family peptidyl-prolyl cis-trans isomerase